jgi:predicted GTPase
VGRAAIDLYSGRLRNAAAAPPRAADTPQAAAPGQDAPQEVPKPLRILVAGQVAAGKSSLISALLRQIRARVDALPPSKGLRAYEFKRDGVAEALLVDSPGIEADDVAIEGLKTQVVHCDLLIWVTSAMGPERGRDRKVLEALRRAARAEGRHPPVLSVHTHVDQLTPILDWTPPYNLDRAESPKAQSIAKALLAVATDLRIPIQSVVPVCLDQMRGAYNVDVLWAKMLDALSEVQRARLGRALAVAGDDGYWKRLSTNANVTGRIVTRGPPSQNDDMSAAARLSRKA